MGKTYTSDNPKLFFYQINIHWFHTWPCWFSKDSEYSIDSMKFSTITIFLRQQEFSIHCEMLQLTSFFPQDSTFTECQWRKKVLLGLSDATHPYKRISTSIGCLFQKRKLLRNIYKTFISLPDIFSVFRICVI